MKRGNYSLSLLLVATLFTYGFTNIGSTPAPFADAWDYPTHEHIATDTIPPVEERDGNFLTNENSNPFDLKDPSSIKQEVEYDPETGYYIITEKIGPGHYRPPTYMTFDEYIKWSAEKQRKDYFKQLGKKELSGDDPIAQFNIKNELTDRLFGGGKISIIPQGTIDLTFGGDYQKVDNPILTERQRRQGGFDFDMSIQMNVVGQIGTKLKLSTKYNTQATFNFQNEMKLEYTGFEDEIIKSIEAGNVSLPLRSSLIQGNQSLFGIKTQLQFGRMTITNVLSQQKSQRQEIQIQGGTQLQTFEVPADRYDENRHFFMTHFNRNDYERALENLPQINTLFKITKMEVWVTNKRNATENVRDIVALSDIGTPDPNFLTSTLPSTAIDPAQTKLDLTLTKALPHNKANKLYQDLETDAITRSLDNSVSKLQSTYGLQQVRDFEKVRARKLSPSEFSYHSDLGYISLNVTLQPDDVLGVAMEYTYNGETFAVGEFAQDRPVTTDSLSGDFNVLYVKLLKSSNQRVDLPIWDLMMKNVYSIGAFQVNQQDFNLDVFYQDPGGGEKRFIPETNIAGRPLISLLNLDNLNRTGDPRSDGAFDFVSGVTINPRNGRVIFPVLEPFGESLEDLITDQNLASRYVYHQLYDSTITVAREYPEFNRYLIRGNYRSSVSSEISLGSFNIPKGSVQVSAGGQRLVEGQDYDIDYNIGRIKIINEAILNSGQPVKVSFEDNALFSFQTKTLIGTRLDYKISEKFNIGATHMRLSERPFTQKVNIGDDPIKNNVFGLDIQFSEEAPWLTKVLDKLPLYQTKEPSNIAFSAEAAWLVPGHNGAVDQNDDNGGVSYLDDFEGSASSFDLRTPSTAWVLSSTPQNDLFPEASLVDSVAYGKNRGKISWYQIEQSLRGEDNYLLSPYTRLVREQEVFPNLQRGDIQNPDIRPLDIVFDPLQRGPYNFDAEPTAISAGLDTDISDGRLAAPKTRWGGIMRSLTTNNFEAANIEFIEMWVLSPFIDEYNGAPENNVSDGNIYINLGSVSEDILRDSRKFFENGLPRPNSDTKTDTTNWGRIPRTQAITNAFDNDPETRIAQDVGLDGLDNEGEMNVFADYVNAINGLPIFGVAKDVILADISADDYFYHRSEIYEGEGDIIKRYSKFNNPQGNSQSPEGQQLSASTNIPDTEDLNRDNTLSETEAYFEYKIPVKRAFGTNQIDLESNEFITGDTIHGSGEPDKKEVWYRIKIPIDQYHRKVGGIQDFRSIRFMRMYLKDFDQRVVFRFARLELVRNQWRRYRRSLVNAFVGPLPDESETTFFDVSAVNIEENSTRTPFSYVLPPGIAREQSLNSITDALQNEQSLAMDVCNLQDGDARGIYKILNLDLRTFKRLRMFVHAEAASTTQGAIADPIEKGEMTMFMRLGSDFENNYYEYEIPLTMTPDEAMGLMNETELAPLVWLDENSFDFELELLRTAKVERDQVGGPLNIPYSIDDPERPDNKVRVVGNPDIGLVKGIMIGVRNTVDDGLPKCVEVWINELRVNGFDERGGMAALARLDVGLADLGRFSASTNYSTIGWGSLEQKVAQRSKEEILQYDVSTNLQLGKFFPKKWGFQLPFFIQYSNTIKTPQFDPYQLDIPLKERLARTENVEDRNTIRRNAQDFTSILSYNFTNVRKERLNTERKPMPWDISNFGLTYAYSQTKHHDPIIENNVIDNYRGGLNYAYSRQAKYITPFKKLIKSKSKYLSIIKDFNFNPVPNSISFNSGLNRYFGETVYRFADPSNNTWYDKRFNWDRTYGLQWNLARSLTFNFSAVNNAVVDEPDGRINETVKRDSVWNNIKNFGRTKNYAHNADVSYTLPTKKIPFLDWTQVKAQYGSNYSWSAASLNTDSLGNVIQNGQKIQLNADLNFVNLYNKSKFLKKINSKKKKKKKGKGKDKRTKGKDSKIKNKKLDGTKSKDDKAGSKKNKNGKSQKGKKKKDKEPSAVARLLLRPLMILRKARFTYAENRSTTLPGFLPTTRFLGQDKGFLAPGTDFIVGFQPSTQWLDDAANKGWVTNNLFLNQQVIQNYSQNMTGQVSLEPFKDFRIEVTANRNFTENHSEYFKVREVNGEFEHLTPRDIGSLTLSFFSVNTMFESLTDDNISATFQEFEKNRAIVSQRLGQGVHVSDGSAYAEGFGRYQQDVLIPSFLAAYTGQDANTYQLDFKKLIPLPNWRLTYNGLSKIELFKKIFSSVSLTHSYKSTMTVNSFATDLEFDGNGAQNSITNNYFSQFEVPNIVISEQFQPLIGIDMRWKNDLTSRFDFKKSRTLAMSFTDYQLSETKTTEYSISLGYRVKGFPLPFKFGKGKKKTNKLENDLDFKFDFSFRDDLTINHLLDQGNSVITRGLKTVRFSPSIDYDVNKQLNVRLFFDRSRTIPATSASFPITNTQAGVNIRFSLTK